MKTEENYAGYYRHTDGGLYRFAKFVWLASDGTRAIEYDHVWPFEEKPWIRVEAEWEGRFSPIAVEEVEAARAGDRLAAQARVTAAREARKEAERRAKHEKWLASWHWSLDRDIESMPAAFEEQFLEGSPAVVRARVEAGDMELFAGCVAFGYVRFNTPVTAR